MLRIADLKLPLPSGDEALAVVLEAVTTRGLSI